MLKAIGDLKPNIENACFVAENATIIGDVTLGKDVNIWYGVMMRGDVDKVTVGDRTNIQEGSIIHVTEGIPTRIGADVTIGHGAIVHACDVGDNCLIGMGAIILDSAVIGENCIIGAGSIVTPRKQIPPGSMVMGSPARVVRELTPEEIEGNRIHAGEYGALAIENRGAVDVKPRSATNLNLP